MKSAHRHQLETNVLAHRLESYIERFKPYTSQALGVIIAMAAAILIWSYIANSSAESRSKAWDSYNHALGSVPLNIDEIHTTAQDNPGTTMQQMADVTWADGQVFMASRAYLDNRKMAMDALDRASSAYQGVIQSSKDERLTGRAKLGLARVYEMQNKLDKARDEYRQVTGAYAKFADEQVQRLENPKAQEAYSWLATAEPPRPQAPMGPGVPGMRPEFSPGEIALPGTTGSDAGKPNDAAVPSGAFENILKGIQQDGKDSSDRYKTDEKPATGSTPPPASKDAPAKDDKGAAPRADAGKSADKPADSAAKTEKPAK